jgi:hypothetical protein
MAEPLDEAALREIEARAAAAPPGPWESYVEGRDMTSGSSFILVHDAAGEQMDVYLTIDGSEPAPKPYRRWNEPLQDFIASARTDVPALIAEVRRLRAKQNP